MKKEFKSMSEIIQAIHESGSSWFHEDTMRVWGTELNHQVFHGRFFLTKDFVAEPRSRRKKWSVREIYLSEYTNSYSIRTHGLACFTKREAMAVVKRKACE